MLVKEEELSEGILNEIRENYSRIDMRYYNRPHAELGPDLINKMVSRKLDYKEVRDGDVKHRQFIDPNTFEWTTINGILVEKYIVRGLFDDESSTAYPWMITRSGEIVEPVRTAQE